MSRTPELLLVGLSHRTAPVAVREKIAVTENHLAEALSGLAALPGVEETFVVSTCNRVEVYASAPSPQQAAGAIREFLAAGQSTIQGHLYEEHGIAAVRHLFRVCSSLDSMVLGEPQILGQVKDAFAAAEQAGSVRGLLGRTAQRAFGVAKRVRTETAIGKSAVSMSFAAVEMARKILGSLEGRTVLLVGAGKMSALAARHLISAGCKKVVVINRSPERATALAADIGGDAVPWESLPSALAQADVVVCSTAASQPVITVELAQAARKARKHRPLFFVDLAVPRDVDPRINTLDGIYVYDVDDLSQVVDENRKAREDEAARAEEIVIAEAESFLAAARSEAGPVLRELRRRCETLAKAEVERTVARGDFTDAQRKSVEAMARALVNKILHEPTLRIRAAAQEQEGGILEAAVELFGIGAELGQMPVGKRNGAVEVSADAGMSGEPGDGAGSAPLQGQPDRSTGLSIREVAAATGRTGI